MTDRLGSGLVRYTTMAAMAFFLLIGTVSHVTAGSLTMTISDGTVSYDIIDQVPPDVNLALNQIQADVSGLVFTDFSIVGLNASSNNPGAPNPTGATLTVGGHIIRTTGGGPVTLTITTYQTGYTIPTGAGLSMISSSSNTYSNVPAGSQQTFESWYNPTSPATPPPPFGIPAPLNVINLAGTDSGRDRTTLDGLPSSSSFSLTNQIVLTIGGATADGSPDITFGGTTQILAVAVPEPTSAVLLGAGLPLGFLVLLLKRRRAERAPA